MKEIATDYNTLPAPINTNRTEPSIEALILSVIANEIMNSENSLVIYSNDGSCQYGVGNCIVQSFSIDGKQLALPTLNIFTESRASLSDFQLMTYKMLAAATAWKFNESDLVNKTDFVMTDSTAHNLGVIEDVCSVLQIENIPDSLVCHVHSMMMFQRKVKDVWEEIHDAFGTSTIKDCSITDIDFRNESLIYKAITCLAFFINNEYSSKSWNRQQHFDAFISPRKNESISVKDHRFNRIFNCCIHILYHVDDIKLYLDTFQNILNGIAILDKTLLGLELLKPIFCATALVEMHFTRPFLSLLLDTECNYETLMRAFPMFYHDLQETSVEPTTMVEAHNGNITFIEEEKFKKTLPKDCLRKVVNSCAIQYEKEVNIDCKFFNIA